MERIQVHISIPKPLYDRLEKYFNAKYKTLTSAIIEAIMLLVDNEGY